MEVLSIKTSVDQSHNELNSHRGMRFSEKLQFCALFMAAVLVTLFIAIILLPFALIGVLEEVRRRLAP